MPTWLRIVFFLLLPVLVWYFVSKYGVPTWLLILFYLSLPFIVWGFIRGFVSTLFRALFGGGRRQKNRRA